MESIGKLINAYRFLSSSVSEKISSTAYIVKTGNRAEAESRLKTELQEALRCRDGVHTHRGSKTASARKLLAQKGLPVSGQDLLLELHQVAYWALVYQLASGNCVDPDELSAALVKGAETTCPVQTLASRIERCVSLATTFAFVGRIQRESGWPHDLFAQLDLIEMAKKPYLEDFLHGL